MALSRARPGFIAARRRSPHWRLTRAPSLATGGRRHATTRLTAGFEYVGPAMDRGEAEALFTGERRASAR